MLYASLRKKAGLLLGCLFISSALWAEDIEIFTNETPVGKPNILFVLDQSGSMDTHINGVNGPTRASTLANAFRSVVSDPDLKDVNIGLMGFSFRPNTTLVPSLYEGDEHLWNEDLLGAFTKMNTGNWPYPHGVSFPVSPIDNLAKPILETNLLPAAMNDGTTAGFFTLSNDSLIDPTETQTVREYLPSLLSSWWVSGGTPLVESLYEAALYFRGAAPDYGNAPSYENQSAHPSTYTGKIYSNVAQDFDGSYDWCVEDNCGANCQLVTKQAACQVGETTCGLGTNCTSSTGDWAYTCSLGSEAACMDSNSSYSRCELVTYESCVTVCDGATDLESGACLGNETQSCNMNSYYNCYIPTEAVVCDQQLYKCQNITGELTTVSEEVTYNSPIKNECGTNAIILLSDGQPFVSDSWDSVETRNKVKTLVERTDACADVPGQVYPETINNTLADGRCGVELTRFLATEDQSTDVVGVNTVRTSTIGFGVSGNPEAQGYLESLAESGGGSYYSADGGYEQLVEVFTNALGDLDKSARSYAAPVYTVDPSTLLAHSNDIYLPLFENSKLPRWSGNLKKFKLDSTGKIVDKLGNDVLDSSGAVNANAVDYWADTSITTDEPNAVTSGGAASQLTTARTLYTDNDSSALVTLNSANVTKTMLGDAGMTDASKDELLHFIQGIDAEENARKHMGDILHSKPTVVNYSGNRQIVFFGTNEGYLHAINAADATESGSGGEEVFAFMPSALLENIKGQMTNTELTGDLKRIYGVDGSMTVLISDTNNNGVVDSGESAYLYFGLRRGGSHMYALNISNPDAPTLEWKISNTDTDFIQLGETWSKPVLAKLRYKPSGSDSAVTDDVLVFGGGYDTRLDEANPASRSGLSTAKGNAVYIVNARTKALIWSSGTTLSHSVPGSIRVLDLDRNGSIDRLYFGDTGGNIWRVDLNVDDVDEDASMFDVTQDARITLFASLGGSGADSRKFFYEPDVSFFKHAGRYVMLITIGSGYRVYPLLTGIEDRFYVLSDENVLNIPLPDDIPAPITDGELISSDILTASFLPNNKGWYKTLSTGDSEKVLASPLIFMNKVMFTTFATNEPTTDLGDNGCPTPSNQTKAYVLDLMTGAAAVDLDGDGEITDADESIDIPRGDILDTPQLVFNAPTNCSSDGCDQSVDIRIGKTLLPIVDEDTGDFLQKVYWLNNK